MSHESIEVSVADGVATVTLNRPDAANTIDLDMARELLAATIALRQPGEARAVLLQGAGSTFCAGGDLKTFSVREDLPAYLEEVTAHLHTAIARLCDMPIPVVAAVHGSAAGAGLGLAMACDLVLGAESSRYVMAYTRVGLTPDGSSTWFLPRLVGLRRALELTLTNRVLSAPEAAEIGLLTAVVPDDELHASAAGVARDLAAGATRALGGAKQLLRAAWSESLEAQMERESHRIAAAARTADGREGIAAFCEKRPPGFTGE